MFDTKTILASRTVWANLIGLAALVLGLFGFDGSALATGAFEEAQFSSLPPEASSPRRFSGSWRRNRL
jgi:hypothetical protein